MAHRLEDLIREPWSTCEELLFDIYLTCSMLMRSTLLFAFLERQQLQKDVRVSLHKLHHFKPFESFEAF
jgi:hypothetical protein